MINTRQGIARRALRFGLSLAFELLAGLYFAIGSELRCYHRRQMRALATGLLLVLAGCGIGIVKDYLVPPEQVGPWRRESVPRLEDGQLPRQYEIHYNGPSKIKLTVHEFGSETSAFEAFQKHRVEPGTLPFYKRRFLLIPAGDDKRQLETFAGELQKVLP
jgi:hypothetical protein